jgi:hypothetical protein
VQVDAGRSRSFLEFFFNRHDVEMLQTVHKLHKCIFH